MNTYTFKLDRDRTLKYTMRSFRDLEKRSGVGVIEKISELSGGKTFSLQYIIDFIWAGLLHENVPYETVIDIIPTNKYLDLTKFIVDVVTQEFGLEVDEKKNQEPLVSKNHLTGEKQKELPTAN